MKKITAILIFVFLPVISNALVQVSDNFTLGTSGYRGNSTDVVLELPAEFNLQSNMSVSSAGEDRSFLYSLGAGRDLFFEMMSLNVLYNANRSDNYVSDGADVSFSLRPFMGLSTFIDFQLEGGYSFTEHMTVSRTKMLPCHSWRIGAGLGILQTTNIAVAYTSYIYMPSIPDGCNVRQITDIIPIHNIKLAGALLLVSGFPGSTIDLSVSHSLSDRLNLYGSYSCIRYSPDKNVSNSYLAGADYSLLENLSLGFACNVFQDSAQVFSYYCSLGINIGF
jgi:hypothetical protein